MLIQTKLFIPTIRTHVITRPALLHKLNEGLAGRLTLVVAPAGFGKTTLVTTWVNHYLLPHNDYDVCWLALDEQDNEPIQFSRYLLAALQTVNNAIGQSLLTQLPQSLSNPSPEITPILVNDILQHERPIFCVLDDWHLVENETIEKVVQDLLTYAPANLHLVLISRREPRFSLGKWRARRQMTEIRAAELRFSHGEIDTFFQEAMALTMAEADVALLAKYTEGWIAGVQMAGLSLQGRSEGISRFVQSFAQHDQYVMDYLTDEVLLQQPDGVVRFLLQTSILEQLSAPLCDVVTGQSDSHHLLTQLDGANLFIVRLDKKGEWYRYHHLFAELLRTRLHNEMDADEIAQLHLQASQWFEANFMPQKSIQHALQGKAFHVAADLIARYAPIVVAMQGEYITVQQWVDQLPHDIVTQHPLLNLSLAQGYLTVGQVAKSRHLADTARAAAAQVAAQVAAQTSVPAQFQPDLLNLRGAIAWLSGELAEGLALTEAALAHAQDEMYGVRAGVYLLRGSLYTLVGDTQKALQALKQSLVISQQGQHGMFHVFSLGEHARHDYIQGRLFDAITYGNRAIELATTFAGKEFPALAPAYSGLAVAFYARDMLPEAIEAAQLAIQCSHQFGVGMSMQYVVDAYCAWAMALQAQGKPSEANKLIRQGLQLARYVGISLRESRLLACQAWLQLQQGQPHLAQRWANGCSYRVADLDNINRLAYVPEHELTVLARIWVNTAVLEAASLLDSLATAAEVAGRWGRALEIKVLQAVYWQEAGDLARALTLLHEAVVAAEAEQYVRLFLDKGEKIRPLLHHLAAQTPALTYVQHLLKRMPPPVSTEPTHVRFTKREREIVHLIMAGHSNREIAERLVISYPTVKRHINNIYAKLDVSSRAQAIVAVQKLPLF